MNSLKVYPHISGPFRTVLRQGPKKKTVCIFFINSFTHTHVRAGDGASVLNKGGYDLTRFVILLSSHPKYMHSKYKMVIEGHR